MWRKPMTSAKQGSQPSEGPRQGGSESPETGDIRWFSRQADVGTEAEARGGTGLCRRRKGF